MDVLRIAHRAAAVRAAALVLLLSGCSVSTPSSDAFPSLDVQIADVAAADLGSGSGEAVDLSGAWYLRSETSNCVNTVGTSVETLNRNWYLVTIRKLDYPAGEAVEALYEATITQCRVDLSPVILNITPHVPAALLDSQEPVVFHFMASSGAGGKVLLSSTPMVELWGVSLQDPVYEALPVDVSDPRVVDDEGDGHPGVTMILGDNFCEMYMVQRAVNIYHGEVESLSLVRGSLVSDMSKNILDGTEALCLTKNDTTANPERNRFMMVRADGAGDYPLFDGDGDGKPGCTDLRMDEIADAAKAAAGYKDLEKLPGICK